MDEGRDDLPGVMWRRVEGEVERGDEEGRDGK